MVSYDVVSFWALVLGLTCIAGAIAILNDADEQLSDDHARGLAHGIALIGVLLVLGSVLGWLAVHVRFV